MVKEVCVEAVGPAEAAVFDVCVNVFIIGALNVHHCTMLLDTVRSKVQIG